jgi:hypothetical protein
VSLLLKADVLSFGNYFRVIADGNDLQDFGAAYVKSHCPDTIVEDFFAFYKPSWDRPVVVEGIRHIAIWRALAVRAEAARLIFLDVEKQMLQRRLAMRAGGADRAALARFEHPVEAESPKLYAAATIVVTADDLSKAVGLIMDRMSRLL